MKTELVKEDIPKHAPDTIDLGDGHSLKVSTEYDEYMGAPWKENDGHGPVSKWTIRDKRPGERMLCTDHGWKRYYDFAGAMKIARHAGKGDNGGGWDWNAAEETTTELGTWREVQREPRP